LLEEPNPPAPFPKREGGENRRAGGGDLHRRPPCRRLPSSPRSSLPDRGSA
jgi:hypothetical protein